MSGMSFGDFLGALGIMAPQSGQNLVPVFVECGGIWYFRDSEDEPHFLQNRSSYLSIVLCIIQGRNKANAQEHGQIVIDK